MASDDMWDLDGWREITCGESNDLFRGDMRVSSGLTDPDGVHGEAVIYREWCQRDSDAPVLRDYLEGERAEPRTCRHYVPEEVTTDER